MCLLGFWGNCEEHSLFKIRWKADKNEQVALKHFLSIEYLINFNLLSVSLYCCQRKSWQIEINEMFHKLEMKLSAECPK